jgi:hypothetical protein
MNVIKMKIIKLLKAALAVGNSLFVLIKIISGIDSALGSDKFPVDLAFVALLIIVLVLLIIYGLRAYQTKKDTDSYFALLAISSLLALFQFLMILALIIDPKLFIPELPFGIFSAIMFLLWVLNVIAYLNRGKWMNK